MIAEEVLKAFFAKTLNLADGEWESLVMNDSEDGDGYKDDALSILLEQDKSRVSKLKGANEETLKERFQNGYNKAKKEERKAFEAELKDALEFDSDLTGTDLVKAMIEAKTPEPITGTVTDDDIKKTRLFQDTIEAHKKQVAEIETEWKQKVEEVETTYSKNQIFSTIKDKALTVLESANPVLPANAEVKANLFNVFASQLNGYEYDIQGERVIITKDGKMLEDGHGNAINFNEFVLDNGRKLFEFKKAEPRSSSGDGNTPPPKPNGTPAWTGKTPESEQEYIQMIQGASSTEEKVAITEAYKSVSS